MDRLQRQLIRIAIGIGVWAGAAACGRDVNARSRDPGPIDSVVSREVALERFRAGLAPAQELAGGALSREELVRAFARGIAAADTATLRGLTLSRAEFAWLYYPTAPQGLPPYDLAPGLMWELQQLDSERGLRRAMDRLGGRPWRYLSHACDPQISRQGANALYGPCRVKLLTGNADTLEQRLFALILERHGRFKFVSLANKLD